MPAQSPSLKTRKDTGSAEDALRHVTLVANRKGGVFKSAICRSVAAELVALGHKVCVIDGDPQGNVSKIDFGLQTDRGRNLAMTLQYGDIDLEPRRVRGVDVVCGGPDLQGALGAAVVSGGKIDLAANLRASLGRLCAARDYDIVLIDSGPGDTQLLDSYMHTARWLIVPAKIDDATLDGVDLVGSRFVEAARGGHRIELLGSVLVSIDPRATARNADALSELSDILGTVGEPFTAMIRYAPANDMDARRRGWAARDVARESSDQRGSRLRALKSGVKLARRGGEDTWWSGTGGSGLAQDYADLTKEVVLRITQREEAARG